MSQLNDILFFNFFGVNSVMEKFQKNVEKDSTSHQFLIFYDSNFFEMVESISLAKSKWGQN